MNTVIRTDWKDDAGHLLFYSLRPNVDPSGKARSVCFLPDNTPISGTPAENLRTMKTKTPTDTQ